MPPFVRFIIAMILIAVCGTLGLVLYTQHHISKWEAINAKRESRRGGKLFLRIDKKIRRADMVVASQTIGGDKSVEETTLIFQRYAVDSEGSLTIPLRPQVLTISGDSPVIRVEVLKFAPDFHFAEDFTNYSGVVAGKTIYLFEDVHGNDATVGRELINGNSDVPPSCQSDPNGSPNAFEKGLWHKIWDLARRPDDAARSGLHDEKFDSQAIEVRPGTVYQVWIDTSAAPIVRQVDDAQEVAEMLSRLPGRPPAPSNP